MQKINLQEPQRNRNANANFVNLIRTSTVRSHDDHKQLRAQKKEKHRKKHKRGFGDLVNLMTYSGGNDKN